jgi:hypothetical protein
MDLPIGLRFAEDGFVVLRGLLTPSDVAFYIAQLQALAGASDRWTEPDGVNRHAQFWPIIFNNRLLAALREIFGPVVRYLPHTDLHVGFSSFSWHRDCVTRSFGDGADWDETTVAYRIARVGIYLQRFDESQFKIGFVTGSHRARGLAPERQRRIQSRTSAAANVLSGLSGLDLLGKDAEWVAPDQGDCIIFDPRILHTGSRFLGRKYSIFIAYGVENLHFRNHWHYYLRLRSDLGYSKVPPALAARLEAADLLAREPPDDLTIDRAWIPSPAYVSLARRFT